MGCVASRLQEEEEVVSICRERKRQLKLAVERRYALAEAHYRYCKSLYGVSAAINLFVARHSSPNAPFYITFPPPSPPKEKVVSNPLFLQQAPSEPTKETIACESCSSSISSVSSEEEREGKREKKQGGGGGEEKLCGYFYMDMPMPQTVIMPSPQRDFGWDFFNPFENVARPEIMNVYNRMSEEEELRAVREKEGIPDLEDEEGERVRGGERKGERERETLAVKVEEKGHEIEAVKGVESAHGGEQEQQRGLSVMDAPVGGRELLEALKDIEDHFFRAYDSGKDVSRMLECNRVHLQSNIDEIKGESLESFSFVKNLIFVSSSCYAHLSLSLSRS